jgi:hypothetical protein
MQLTPRYLVKNRTLIISNEVGFVTEYRPVYQRELQVYRGIDNVLEFQVLNSDQKPVPLTGKQVNIVVFDSSKNMIVNRVASVINANKGLVTVTISENDVLNVKQQYLHYNIYIVNADDSRSLTYTDEHFNANAVMYLSSTAYPGPRASVVVDSFVPPTGAVEYYASEAISAEPGINGNEAVHTAVVYTNGYIGDIVIEATLENQIIGQSNVNWTEIVRLTFIGNEEHPTPVNFIGVLSYIRVLIENNPVDAIEKILIRN